MDTENGGCGWDAIEVCIFAEVQSKKDLLGSFDWVQTEIYIREGHSLAGSNIFDSFKHQTAIAHRHVLLKYFREYIENIEE